MNYTERWKLLFEVVLKLSKRECIKGVLGLGSEVSRGKWSAYAHIGELMVSDHEMKDMAVKLGIITTEHWYPRGYGIVEHGQWFGVPVWVNESDYDAWLDCSRHAVMDQKWFLPLTYWHRTDEAE